MAEKRGGGEITCTRPRGPRRFKGKEGGSRSLAPRPAPLRAHGRNVRRLWWPSASSSDGRVPRVAGTRVSGADVLLPRRCRRRRRRRRRCCRRRRCRCRRRRRPHARARPTCLAFPCSRARGFPLRLPSLAFPFHTPLQSLSLLSWAASTLHGRRTRRERILSAHTRARRAPQEARFSSADDSRPSSPL